MKLTFTALLVTCFCQLSSAQPVQEAIEEIRAHFKYVNDNQSKFEITKGEVLGESSDGGVIEKYFDNDEIVKISLEYFGESGKLLRDYYIRKGELLFVFDQNFKYNVPYYIDSLTAITSGDEEWFDPSKTKVEESRFYFFKGEMIRWINAQGVFQSTLNDQWLEKEKYYIEGLNSIR